MRKTAVVSGASSGIGMEICKTLLYRGWRVVGVSRRIPKISDPEFRFVRADLESRKFTIDISGKVNALVNCAGGIVHFDALSAFSAEKAEDEFNKNFLSAVRLTSAVLPRFGSDGGCIVNISSVYGIRPQSYAPGYSASKAALINYTQFLANHLAPKNIRANAVCPGHVLTPSWKAAGKSIQRKVGRHVPAGRMGKPQDIAGLVAFLLSDEAKWITGSCFVVDGGCLSRLNCIWE